MGKKVIPTILLFIYILNTEAQWSPIGTGIGNSNSTSDFVESIASFNNEIYACGKFTTSGLNSTNNIAKWNGSSWSAVGTGMDFTTRALVVYNGELYAGGNFTTAGGSFANYIAKWNGSNWSPVGIGMNQAVYCLCVYNGELYAGGIFTTAGGTSANHVAKWNGTSWSAAGSGMNPTFNANVYSLYVFNNELYAGGNFTIAGGNSVNNIAKWNGTSWSGVGSGITGSSSTTVISITSYNNNIIAGGIFTTAGSISANNIAKWDGNSWSNIGSGTNDAVVSLETFDNQLFVGGHYTIAGGSSVSYIAKWDGNSWSSLGSGTDSSVIIIKQLNTELYVGGNFRMAGGSAASHIAKWLNCNIPAQPGVITGNNSVCSGSSQTYSVQAVQGATSYTWTFPSGWVGSSTSNTITLTAGSNNGNISVKANNSCGSSMDQVLAVVTNNIPNQPSTISGNLTVSIGQSTNYSILPVAGATGYNWALNGGGSIISGQNTSTITISWTLSGSYSLSVNAINTCGISNSQTTNVIVSVATAVVDPNNPFELTISPNPAQENIIISAKGVINKRIQIQVLNMLGQEVYQTNMRANFNTFSQSLQLGKLPNGLYKLKILIGNNFFTKNIILSK